MAIGQAPARFVFDDTQLAAALAIAGIRPEPGSPLAQLPTPRDPLAALAGTNALAGSRLSEEAAAALRAYAAPLGTVAVVANRAGTEAWRELSIVRGGADGPYVARSIQGPADLVLFPTETQAVIAIDAALSLSDLPSASSRESIRLSFAGYAALLALADALAAAYLRARLARSPQPQQSWSADEVEKALAEALAQTDTRWPATAARFVSPVPLTRAQGRLAAGVAELRTRGLVREEGGRSTLTPAGYDTALALTEVVVTGGITAYTPVVTPRVAYAQTSVFRCATSVWMAMWSAVSADDAQVELVQVSAGTALQIVRSFLTIDVSVAPATTPAPVSAPPAGPTPAPAGAPTAATPKFCGSCGTPTQGSAAFCGSCGAPLRR